MLKDTEFFTLMARMEASSTSMQDSVLLLTDYIKRLLTLIPEADRPTDIVQYVQTLTLPEKKDANGNS
jgi:hypothetical protein